MTPSVLVPHICHLCNRFSFLKITNIYRAKSGARTFLINMINNTFVTKNGAQKPDIDLFAGRSHHTYIIAKQPWLKGDVALRDAEIVVKKATKQLDSYKQTKYNTKHNTLVCQFLPRLRTTPSFHRIHLTTLARRLLCYECSCFTVCYH